MFQYQFHPFWRHGVSDGVLLPPHLRVGRGLGRRRDRRPQFAVVAVQIESRAEWGEDELPELAKPISEGRLVAGQRCVTASDRLEVLDAAASHFEHVRGWRPQLSVARCGHLFGAPGRGRDSRPSTVP